MYLSAETKRSQPLKQVLEKLPTIFGSIEFGVDCNVSVQGLDFLSFYLLKMPLNVLPLLSRWTYD